MGRSEGKRAVNFVKFYAISLNISGETIQYADFMRNILKNPEK